MTTLTMPVPEIGVRRRGWLHLVLAAAGVLALLVSLAVVVMLIAARQHLTAAGVMAVLGAGVLIYIHPRLYAWRYVVPGALAALVFIVVPMGYTVAIGFTNYSSEHLLPFDRATEVLMSRTNSDGAGFDFRLLKDGARHRIGFTGEDGKHYLSAPFDMGPAQRVPVDVSSVEPDDSALPLLSLIHI